MAMFTAEESREHINESGTTDPPAPRATRGLIRSVLAFGQRCRSPEQRSPMGGQTEALRLGLSEGDGDGQLWRRRDHAEHHLFAAALAVKIEQHLEQACPRFDRLAFDLSTDVIGYELEDKVVRRCDLMNLDVRVGDEEGPCLAPHFPGEPADWRIDGFCKRARRGGSSYCVRHQECVAKGHLKPPNPAVRVTRNGDEYVRDATEQDVRPYPKPHHRWGMPDHLRGLGLGDEGKGWVFDEESTLDDKGNPDPKAAERIAEWEARATRPSPSFVVVRGLRPQHRRPEMVAAHLESEVTVNEALQTAHRRPLEGPEGKLTVAAYLAASGGANADSEGIRITARRVERALRRFDDFVAGLGVFNQLLQEYNR